VANNLYTLPVEELILDLSKGSPENASAVCEELIRRFQPLLRKCWARLNTPTIDYQDFVQDVFVRLLQGLPALRNLKAFPGYFRRITISVMMDHFRQREHGHAVVDIDDVVERIAAIDRDVLHEIFIWSCLEHLGGREQEVIRLELMGLNAADIASHLGISPGAVRMTQSRAVARLRNVMLKHSQDVESEP
jgi:RNA polymerase sigma-70 factor (ECF subfamily)